ncbi:polyhydroxyalkanoic acid system family protein [Phenylobacterium sp.]|uniref:polyhydroxyalkanoic acid system family protein n=1 Tax=Phenylobacterium sp. TaxID=1871053 RepID=UPI00301C89BD
MSKPVVVNIPHQLGRAEARRRIEEGLGGLTRQIGAVGRLDSAWAGDVLSFQATAVGQEVSGAVTVADDEVRLEIRLPGLLGLLADKIRGKVQAEGRVLLEGPKRS